jgi:hypothetical protein
MSSRDDENKTPAEHPAKHRPKGEYERGYCKPPIEHQFKPGNNMNPKGRKKGSRSRKVVIEEVLFEQITVREGTETKQMSKLEAVLKKTFSQALAGDKKAALTIIGLAQKEGFLTREEEEAVENLPESDAAIMEDVKRRLGVAPSEHASEAPAQSRSAAATEPPQGDACQSVTGLPKLTRPVLTDDPSARASEAPAQSRSGAAAEPPRGDGGQSATGLPKLTRPVHPFVPHR